MHWLLDGEESASKLCAKAEYNFFCILMSNACVKLMERERMLY